MLLMERVSRAKKVASSDVKKNTYVIVAAIFIAVLANIFIYALRIPPEAALNLQCGLLIAEGKTPYVDFFEVASPALMYLHVIPAVVSKALSQIHPIIIFNLFVLALSVGSCVLSAEILFRQRIREQAHVPFFIVGLALLNLLAIGEFGQREHLFLLLYIPFLLTRWLSWSNQPSDKRLSTLAGTLGGISMCLDPLLLAIALTMEVFFLLSKMKWRPFNAIEMKVAGGVVILFICHFAFVPREFSNLYFNWALPMVLTDYLAFDDRLWWVGKTPDRRNLVYFMVIACVFALGLRRWSSLISPCVALSLIGFFMFVLEGKSMTYQMLPMAYGAALAFVLVTSVVAHVLHNQLKKPIVLKPALAAVLSLAAAGASVFWAIRSTPGEELDLSKFGYLGSTRWIEPTTFATNLGTETSVGEKVLILNDRQRPAYPLLIQYNRRPATYLLTGYPLRMSRLLMETFPDRAAAYSGTQFEMYERLINDIKTVKPKFMMIEKESLGEVLTEHKVYATIDAMYDELGYSEWPDSDVESVYDYYAFRTALVMYKLKSETKPAEGEGKPETKPVEAPPSASP